MGWFAEVDTPQAVMIGRLTVLDSPQAMEIALSCRSECTGY
jgi:hypothetical protein